MIKGDTTSINDAADIILEEVRKDHDLRIENYEEGYMRAQLAKQFLRTYFRDRKGLENEDSKIGIVSHGMFLRCFTAEGYDPRTDKLVNGIDMKNCAI